MCRGMKKLAEFSSLLPHVGPGYSTQIVRYLVSKDLASSISVCSAFLSSLFNVRSDQYKYFPMEFIL